MTSVYWWSFRNKAGSLSEKVEWIKAKKGYRWKKDGKGLYFKEWKSARSTKGEDVTAGLDCLRRVSEATWWEWKGGSRIFFWQWTKERLGVEHYLEEARDGAKIDFDLKPLPKYSLLQKEPIEQKQKIMEKLRKFLTWRYLEDCGNRFVQSLVSFFDVLKGEDDIRVVFNGTLCGFNVATWAHGFLYQWSGHI